MRISEKLLALKQMLKIAKIYFPSFVPSIQKELVEENLRIIKRDALRLRKSIFKKYKK